MATIIHQRFIEIAHFDWRVNDLYLVDINWVGKDKIRKFKLNRDFRDVAAELGWPEVWEAEEAKKKEANDLKNSRTTKK